MLHRSWKRVKKKPQKRLLLTHIQSPLITPPPLQRKKRPQEPHPPWMSKTPQRSQKRQGSLWTRPLSLLQRRHPPQHRVHQNQSKNQSQHQHQRQIIPCLWDQKQHQNQNQERDRRLGKSLKCQKRLRRSEWQMMEARSGKKVRSKQQKSQRHPLSTLRARLQRYQRPGQRGRPKEAVKRSKVLLLQRS